jgi:Lon protease-like protein
VLISEGVEAQGPLATPYTVGCSARITQVQPLGQGRMNLVAVGEERFQVLNLDRDSQAYLVGEVEMQPMAVAASAQLDEIGGRLRERVLRYLEVLSEAGDVQIDPDQIPTDALKLANFAAFLVRVEADEKQRLLEKPSQLAFVRAVGSLFSRENALLETMITQSQREQEGGNPGPFSLN